MPEVITRHPDVLIEELQSAGVRCGEGIKQQILTRCPKERFCRAPTGEICVYTMEEVPSMTQIHLTDLSEVLTGVPTIWSQANVSLMVLVFGIGMVVGMFINRKRK